MTNDRKEFTLRGYLDVIRRGRWLILIVAVVAAAAAFGYAKLQKPSYSATATMTYNDPNQGLALTGSSFLSQQTPLQQAAVAAPQVTRPEVVSAVQKQLGSSVNGSSVSSSVDPNSYVINVTASSHNAAQAAAIANAFAHTDVSL